MGGERSQVRAGGIQHLRQLGPINAPGNVVVVVNYHVTIL